MGRYSFDINFMNLDLDLVNSSSNRPRAIQDI